jgi:hypothetical protein
VETLTWVRLASCKLGLDRHAKEYRGCTPRLLEVHQAASEVGEVLIEHHGGEPLCALLRLEERHHRFTPA